MALIKLPLRQKIQLFACLASMILLILTILAYISYDLNFSKRKLSIELIQQSEIIGETIATKLIHPDPMMLSQILNDYSLAYYFTSLWVYSPHGQLLAEYNPQHYENFLSLDGPRSQVIFSKHFAGIMRNVYEKNKIIGTIVIVSSTRSLEYRAIYQIGFMLMIAFFAVLSVRLFPFSNYQPFKNGYKLGIEKVDMLLDTVEDKEAQEKIKLYDLLTNLPNRTLFMTQVEAILTEAKLKDEKYALILIGLNNFKVINNTYGHEVGDYLLQALAKRLTRCLTKYDVLARVAGDEFAMFIARSQGRPQDLKHISQDILDVLSANFVIDEHDILLLSAIGVSTYPEDADNIHSLFLHAAIALYHAKRANRNAFRFYTKEMNMEVQSRQRIELLLRNAMVNNEFLLFYQPKIDVKTGAICGAEALLRWHNIELGWVPSSEFISISEENGTIVPLGKWVIKTACEQVKKWHEMGYSELKVSVNISGHQFRTGDLIKEVARILSDTQLKSNTLDLEITESVVMDNMDRSNLRLKVLKAMGITLSIDDFGTGYSSLSYLRRLPIDSIKIDKSFISHVCDNAEDASIVKAIVVMSKSLKIHTIAEGVETQEQRDFLIRLGVDELQGFYFSHPLTVAEFTTLLKENSAKILSS